MRFAFGGRKAGHHGLVSVCIGDGLTLASVERRRGAPPRLLEAAGLSSQVASEPRAMRAELHRLGLTRSRCTALLGADEYQLLLVEAPRVEPAELRAAIRWRIKDLIDFHLDDAVLDVFEIPGQRQHAQRQAMMYAVVARAAAVRRRVDAVEAAGLKIQVVDIPEMALRNIAALAEEDVHGAVTLHLGETDGLIVLTRQQHLYLARRIEVGGGALRTALSSDTEGSGAAAPLLDAVALEIQRSVDYYDRHFGQPPLAGVIVAPPGPGLAQLEPQLNSRIGLPVRRLDLNVLIESARPLDETQQAHFVLAIGAALRHEEAVL